MARFPTGLYPEGNGELLLKNRNDIRFAFMKHHFGHRMGEQLREWYAYLQEQGESQGLFIVIQMKSDTKEKKIEPTHVCLSQQYLFLLTIYISRVWDWHYYGCICYMSIYIVSLNYKLIEDSIPEFTELCTASFSILYTIKSPGYDY